MRSPGPRDARYRAPRRRGVRCALAVSLGIHAALLAGLMVTRRLEPPTEPVTVELLIEGSEGLTVPPWPETPTLARPAGVAAAPTASPSPRRPKGAMALSAGAGASAPEVPSASQDAMAPAPLPSAEGSGAPGGLATFQSTRPDLRGALKFLPEENRRDVLAPPMARPSSSPAADLPKVLHGGAGVTASIAEDGRIRLHGPGDVSMDGLGPQATASGAGAGVSGRFDLTDQVMKWAGQDPYAAIKSKLADETREQRLCMARRYQGERQKQELRNLSGKIRRIAAQVDLSATERRRLIFEIWDECLEESDARSDYGVMARATILVLVREVFPEGSELAYRPAELVALNGRRSSRQPFLPYQPSGATPPRHPDAGAPAEPGCGVL